MQDFFRTTTYGDETLDIQRFPGKFGAFVVGWYRYSLHLELGVDNNENL